MPGGKARGRIPQTVIAVSVPDALIQRIERRIAKHGDATSVADFIRQSASEQIGRLEDEERARGDVHPAAAQVVRSTKVT